MRQKFIKCAAAFVLLTGCAETAALMQQREAPPKARTPQAAVIKPPEAPPPDAVSEEQFDTTTAEDRAKAAQRPPGRAPELGKTVVSLGDPSKPGFWLETPLVDAPVDGRVEYPETGKSAQVQLIPIEGPDTAGSRISLPAMRLVDAPLTELVELRVYRQ